MRREMPGVSNSRTRLLSFIALAMSIKKCSRSIKDVPVGGAVEPELFAAATACVTALSCAV